jgi:hypothetical protein
LDQEDVTVQGPPLRVDLAEERADDADAVDAVGERAADELDLEGGVASRTNQRLHAEGDHGWGDRENDPAVRRSEPTSVSSGSVSLFGRE